MACKSEMDAGADLFIVTYQAALNLALDRHLMVQLAACVVRFIHNL